MTRSQERAVLVGYDGSEPARRALDWALDEARTRHVGVVVLHAYDPVARAATVGYGALATPALAGELEVEARRVVEEAEQAAAASHADVPVTGIAALGPTSATLLDHAKDATLVVLGSRGLGGFRGLLLGSVGLQVSAHAPCPVVVVRGDEKAGGPDTGRVVVGVDGSEVSNDAIAFAFDHASRHRLPLTALHAWEVPVYDTPGVLVPPATAMEEVADDEVRVTAEVLSGWFDTYPDVTVEQQVVHGSAERAVVKASEGAALVVVGTRGRGGFAGLILGSVSHAALHHAHCPVAVVRPRRKAG